MTSSDHLRLAARQRMLLAVPEGPGSRWVEARALPWSADLFWLQCPGDPAMLEALSEGHIVLQTWRVMDVDPTPADRERLIQCTLKLQATYIRRGVI